VLEWHSGRVVSPNARNDVLRRKFDLKACLQLWGADDDTCSMPTCRDPEPEWGKQNEERGEDAGRRDMSTSSEPEPEEREQKEERDEDAGRWECPACGEPNKASRLQCNGCRASKPGLAQPPPTRSAEAQPAPAPAARSTEVRRGDTVYYQGSEKAFRSGDRLTYCLRGKVVGFVPDGRVEVKFEGHRLTTPVKKAELSKAPVRYQSGDTVFYTGDMCSFRSGDRLVPGMRGAVLDLEDGGKVSVRFEGHRCDTPLTRSELSKGDPYQEGDTVFYAGNARAFESGDRLRAGMRGAVVELKGDGKVSVKFDGHRCNTPTSRLELSKEQISDPRHYGYDDVEDLLKHLMRSF